MQTTPEIISLVKQVGVGTAIGIGIAFFLYKAVWPYYKAEREQKKVYERERADKEDAERAADRARVSAVFEDGIKWSRQREDTILRELTATLQHFGKTGERTDENVQRVLDELRRK